jgi:hypothetical protein
MNSAPIRRTVAATAALLLPLLTLGMPVAAADLEPTVTRISRQLQEVWQQDPLTAPRPVPVVELLPPGRTPSQACPDATGLGAATAALHCRGSGKVLLERGKVKISHDIYKQGGVAFWIALGMAQALPVPAAERAETGEPAAAASLQRRGPTPCSPAPAAPASAARVPTCASWPPETCPTRS